MCVINTKLTIRRLKRKENCTRFDLNQLEKWNERKRKSGRPERGMNIRQRPVRPEPEAKRAQIGGGNEQGASLVQPSRRFDFEEMHDESVEPEKAEQKA